MTTRGSPSTDDPAASMSLLRDLLRDEQAPALTLPASPRTTRDVLALVAVIAVIAAILTGAAVQRQITAPASERARQALVDRVQARESAVAAAASAVVGERERLTTREQQLLASTAVGELVVSRLATVQLLAGVTPVTGPGVSVELNDSEALTREADDPGRVQDRDVQLVVNGLWHAGAEAVAVNGIRLTSTSAIRAAGRAILVDYRPVLPPYRVDAIGDPATLQSRCS